MAKRNNITPEEKSFKDQKSKITRFLKAKDKGLRVTQGRGTARTFITIRQSRPGGLTAANATTMNELGIRAREGEVSVDILPKNRQGVLRRIGVLPRVEQSRPRRAQFRSFEINGAGLLTGRTGNRFGPTRRTKFN